MYKPKKHLKHRRGRIDRRKLGELLNKTRSMKRWRNPHGASWGRIWRKQTRARIKALGLESNETRISRLTDLWSYY